MDWRLPSPSSFPPGWRGWPPRLFLIARGRLAEQARAEQLLVSRDDIFGNRVRRALGVGVAPAEIYARAHEDVLDQFKFLISVIVDVAGLSAALEAPDISGCDIVEMALIAARREHFGLVEDTKKLRHDAQEFEKSAEALGLLLGARRRRIGALLDEGDHLQSDGRQQLIEQFLTVLEMIVESTLSDLREFGDPGDGSFRITEAADDLGGGVEKTPLDLVVPLGAAQFWLRISRRADALHRAQSGVCLG